MTSPHGDRIEVVYSGPTQTLLHVTATYPAMVALLGAPQPEHVGDVDKSWHGWEITAPDGTVHVYDSGRHLTPDPDGDNPALHPTWNVEWHVNASGADLDHYAAAHHVAALITADTDTP